MSTEESGEHTGQSTPGAGCDGHPGVAGEVRQLAAAAVERLQPWLDRLTQVDEEAPANRVPTSCAVCPVCAVIAALRGERPELTRRLAEHASGLLMVLRMALEEGDPEATGRARATSARSAGTADVPAGRTVERIHVHRTDHEPS